MSKLDEKIAACNTPDSIKNLLKEVINNEELQKELMRNEKASVELTREEAFALYSLAGNVNGWNLGRKAKEAYYKLEKAFNFGEWDKNFRILSNGNFEFLNSDCG